MNGLHLIGDLTGCRCDPQLLLDGERFRAKCLEMVESSGLTTMDATFHQFEGSGFTGTVVLAESHLAIHTWPERQGLTLDIYVCNYSADNSLKARSLFDQLVAHYGTSDRDEAVARFLKDRQLPMGIGRPEDVAHAAVFLASPLARFITGAGLDIGGTIARVSLTVPDVADAMVTAPTQLLIHGKQPGTISMFVWDRMGAITTYEVIVRRDLSALVEQVKTLFPGEDITVAGSGKDVGAVEQDPRVDVPRNSVGHAVHDVGVPDAGEEVAPVYIAGRSYARIERLHPAQADRVAVSFNMVIKAGVGHGVAPPPHYGRVSSIEPREYGGNIDNKEFVPGTSLFLPVFVAGAKLSIGDGHAVQGDGEVCGTAVDRPRGQPGGQRTVARRDRGPDAKWFIVVTRAGEKTVGILVNALVRQQEVVIKSIGERLEAHGVAVAFAQTGHQVERALEQRGQHFLAVEHGDVLGLDHGHAAHRPHQLNVVGLLGLVQQVHADFFRQVAGLAVVAPGARRGDVVPGVATPARDREHVVTRKKLAAAQLALVPAAVLAAVSVTRKQKGVGNLPPEPARHVDEALEPDHERRRHPLLRGAEDARVVCLEHLGLAVEHQPQGPLYRQNRQRFVRCVERQTPHVLAPLLSRVRAFPVSALRPGC
mgnify:CR=1 FL=1